MVDETLEDLAARALRGDKAALSTLVAALQDDVYGLAFRMLGHRADAEDATQEILVKAVTHLGSFAGKSKLSTWVYRIAANHLISMRRGRREMFSFEMMEGFIAQGLAAQDAAPPPTGETRVLEEEVRLGCTQGALLSLDREHRVAFVLGALLDLPGDVAAEVLEVEPAAYRKRLSRARARIAEFMGKACGIADEKNPCRCAKQIGPSIAAGMIDPQSLVYITHPAKRARDPRLLEYVAEMKDLEGRATALVGGHPEYVASEGLVERIRALIDSGRFTLLDA
jgi:RNA polymerase sigma factor (sigma-70 family)